MGIHHDIFYWDFVTFQVAYSQIDSNEKLALKSVLRRSMTFSTESLSNISSPNLLSFEICSSSLKEKALQMAQMMNIH